MSKTEQKRVPLSMARLYKLAMKHCKTKKEAIEVSAYLSYVSEHKNDKL